MKMLDWFKNEWIGKATLEGLKKAMEDLDYTWGGHANNFKTDKPLSFVKDKREHREKIAA
jgi:hypothetical protein